MGCAPALPLFSEELGQYKKRWENPSFQKRNGIILAISPRCCAFAACSFCSQPQICGCPHSCVSIEAVVGGVKIHLMDPSSTELARALVLGGGGVAGIAWEVGLLLGLHDNGVDVRNANLIIGTSAGSVVGAQIAGGTGLGDLFARQTAPIEQSQEQYVAFDATQLERAFQQAVMSGPFDPQSIRARIGAMALAAPSVPEEERLAIIASRLPVHEWSQQPLLITVVDAQNGEWRVFDRDSGVPLVQAVAASCAVPGVWPPVTIQGRRYMDGGMRSSTNADLASGYSRVLIVNPLPSIVSMGPLLGSSLNTETALLQGQGSRVLVITADEAAVAAMGPNLLDPASRPPSAQAGRVQGAALAQTVRELWGEG